MNNNIFKIQKSKICNVLLLKKRSAISEIIITLLMVAITMVGATLIWVLFSSSEVTSIGQSVGSSAESTFGGIKLTGYDTRDGDALSGISTISNTKDSLLCAAESCGNTDYIVLKIRSLSSDLVAIESVQINNIPHRFDSATAGVNILTGSGPDEGKFSIIPISNGPPIIQRPSSEVTNLDVRLVIKLSPDMDSEIQLDKVMIVIISVSDGEPSTFLIPAGATV